MIATYARSTLLAALCTASFATHAGADEPADAAAEPSIGAQWRITEWPVAGAAPAPAGLTASSRRSEIETRLWLTAGRTSIGFGLGAPSVFARDAQPWSGERLPASMLVGVGYQLSARSRVYVDAAALDDLPRDRDVRIGFEFKPASSPALGLARGSLLRVQWSSQSQLSLRVRSGGLAIALRSQF